MSKKSTLELWDFLLKEEYSTFDKSLHKILSATNLEPKQKTINNILAYASSLRGIETKSEYKILVSLN